MTSWRSTKRMSRKLRATYDAKHAELRSELDAQAALDAHYAEQLNRIPEDRFQGDQIKLDLTKEQRRAQRFRETFQ